MVDRACAEENIFFFSLLSDTEKRSARGEYDAFFFFFFFFERESFSARVSIKPKKESRERFFTLQKTFVLCSLSPPKKRPHVLFFVSAFFHCPHFLAPKNTKFKKKYITALFYSHISAQTDRRARVYNHELLL
jgi:hypothetical protein